MKRTEEAQFTNSYHELVVVDGSAAVLVVADVQLPDDVVFEAGLADEFNGEVAVSSLVTG